MSSPPGMLPSRRRTRTVLLMNLPATGLILVMVLYPVIYSLWISLHSYNLRRPDATRLVGLDNYRDVLADGDFHHALGVTLIFALLAVSGVTLVGMGLALLFNREFRGRGFARALLLAPWAIPGIVNGLMWSGILSRYGALNGLLTLLQGVPVIGGFVPTSQSLLTHPYTALPAVAAAHVWKEAPFAAIVFLAGLQAIPVDQYRAARVDGASAWRTFVSITLPWLLHPLLIVAIFQTMAAFRTFDLIYTLTGGGPGRATTVIAWQTYREAFTFLDFGRANAYSYLIALITLSLTLIYVRLLYRRGEIRA